MCEYISSTVILQSKFSSPRGAAKYVRADSILNHILKSIKTGNVFFCCSFSIFSFTSPAAYQSFSSLRKHNEWKQTSQPKIMKFEFSMIKVFLTWNLKLPSSPFGVKKISWKSKLLINFYTINYIVVVSPATEQNVKSWERIKMSTAISQKIKKWKSLMKQA